MKKNSRLSVKYLDMTICLNLLFSNLSCQKYRHQSTTIIVAFGKVTPNGEALVMGPSPGPVRARPGSVHFLGLGHKIFEKGIENLSFYEVKGRGPSRLRL